MMTNIRTGLGTMVMINNTIIEWPEPDTEVIMLRREAELDPALDRLMEFLYSEGNQDTHGKMISNETYEWVEKEISKLI